MARRTFGGLGQTGWAHLRRQIRLWRVGCLVGRVLDIMPLECPADEAAFDTLRALLEQLSELP